MGVFGPGLVWENSFSRLTNPTVSNSLNNNYYLQFLLCHLLAAEAEKERELCWVVKLWCSCTSKHSKLEHDLQCQSAVGWTRKHLLPTFAEVVGGRCSSCPGGVLEHFCTSILYINWRSLDMKHLLQLFLGLWLTCSCSWERVQDKLSVRSVHRLFWDMAWLHHSTSKDSLLTSPHTGTVCWNVITWQITETIVSTLWRFLCGSAEPLSP